MGVAMILADKSFEEVADGTQHWVVSAQYDFDKEKYGSFVVVNKTDVTSMEDIDADEMFVQKSATALTDTTVKSVAIATTHTGKPDDSDLYQFNTDDDVIGRINTSGKMNYIVIISEQDLSNAKVTLSATP